MKSLRFSLIISLIVHFIPLILFFSFRQKIPRESRSIYFEIISEVPITKTQLPTQMKIPSKIQILPEESVPLLSSHKPQPFAQDSIAHFDSLVELLRLSDTSSIFNQEEWKTFVIKRVKKQYLISQDTQHSQEDSNVLIFSLGELENPVTPGDEISDRIDKRNQGVKPLMLPLGTFSKFTENKSKEQIPPQFDFIPTEAQIQALSLLYKKKKATQLDIYSALDTTLPITAEVLNQNLNVLVKKGFLLQKKISPENNFSFFGIPIEMSRKNRLNPIYLYQPIVSRTKIMTYLQSRLYLLKEKLRSTPTDSSMIIPKIQNLQEKIQILIE